MLNGLVVHDCPYKSLYVNVAVPPIPRPALNVTVCTSDCCEALPSPEFSTSYVNGSSPLGHKRVLQSLPEYPPVQLHIPVVVSHEPLPRSQVPRPEHSLPLRPYGHAFSEQSPPTK